MGQDIGFNKSDSKRWLEREYNRDRKKIETVCMDEFLRKDSKFRPLLFDDDLNIENNNKWFKILILTAICFI